MTLNTVCSAFKATLQYEIVARPAQYLVWHYSKKAGISPIKQGPLDSIQDIRENLDNAINILAGVLLFGVIACPIVEELIFRGAVQYSAEYVTGSETIGFLAASILFSFAHFPNKKDPLAVIYQLTNCYFLYGPLRASGGITASITAHMTQNLVASIPIFTQVFLIYSGLKNTPMWKPT